jgi:predicted MPP superfamily phosphohydrolase
VRLINERISGKSSDFKGHFNQFYVDHGWGKIRSSFIIFEQVKVRLINEQISGKSSDFEGHFNQLYVDHGWGKIRSSFRIF